MSAKVKASVREVSRAFSGLSVDVRTGSESKKRLANRVQLRIEDDRSDTTVKLTIREAQALRKFLNESLGDQ